MGQFDGNDTATGSGTIDSLTELESTPIGKTERWRSEITAAEKEMQPFMDSARKVQKRYIDNRDTIQASSKWINLFNATVGIMEASLYANIPKPDVTRKFRDSKDDIARTAGMIIERAMTQDMQDPDCDFDQVMRHCVSDRLVVGLGTAWLRLEVETQELTDPSGETILDPESQMPLEGIASQEVAIDYVYWEDFLMSPCRVYDERRWVARKVLMTRDALVRRFGEELGKTIPLNHSAKSLKDDSDASKNILLKRACIYEIWDREKREVIWFSKGTDKLLDVKSDPLGLEDFEPCPKPLFANLTTSKCLPKPDYSMLQDQYTELDDVNNRISLLIEACKVVGVYDKGAEGIGRMLKEGNDNTMIPVDNWAMFAEKGGVKGQIDWLPLDQIVMALDQLTNHRASIKADIYELTGINDIVRGNTKASETLGAQELKSKYASVRIQKLQDEVTRFGEAILKIKAEILVKHFSPEMLMQMSNIANTESFEYAEPAMALIKDGSNSFQWRVSIGADMMAMTDHTQQKQERSEFMTSVATFLQSASSVGQGSPQLVPLMLEMLQFGIAGFRISKDLESTFDKYIKDFKDQLEASKNAPEPPDPEVEKLRMEQEAAQQKAQLDAQVKMQDAKLKSDQVQQQIQADQQMAMQGIMEMKANMQMEREKFNMEIQMMHEKFIEEIKQLRAKSELSLEIQAAKAAQQADESTSGVSAND